MEHQKFLLIIDNSAWDSRFSEYFDKFNYKIIQQNNLSNMHKTAKKPAALLINWSFCKSDISILKQLYQTFSAPIIVISDQKNENACINVLEAGADDFLTKPIHPRELHARITAIDRRVRRSSQMIEHEKETFLFANWRLYPASRQVFNDKNEELPLSVGEYDLLLAFIRQPQQILGREFLLQLTKNSDLNPFDRRIDVQISRLRQKIETDAKKPALIKTIRNGGYLFTASVIAIKEIDNKSKE